MSEASHAALERTASKFVELVGTMSDQRKGEIALMLLKHHLSQEGLKINRHTQRRIGQVANEIGIDAEELTMFGEAVLQDMLNEHVRPPRN